MRAAVLHASGDVRVEEIAKPEAHPGEVLVKVAYCGICGSDIPRLVKDAAHYFPIVLGHEFSGFVEAVGEGDDTSLIGRKVSCVPLIPNFAHPQSALGNYSLGKGYSFIGSRQQGGYAEYVVMPRQNAFLLDDSTDLLDGAFMEPITVGLHAANIMNFRSGRSVALVGAGGIGLLLLQCLKALGAGKIAAFDVAPERLEVAKALGADAVFNSREESVVEQAESFAGERGFEMVFETAGAPPAAILVLRLAAPKGHVMYVSTPTMPTTIQPNEFELINRKELTVQASWMNYSAPFPGWEWEFGASLMAKGRIRTRELIDRVLPLSEAAVVPTLLKTPGALKGKVVFDCSK